MPDAPSLAQGAAKARAEQSAAPPEVVEARTAFLVFLDSNGGVGSTPNLDQKLKVDHQPSAEEVKFACDEISQELHMQKQAVITTNTIVQQQMQMAQQARAAQEASKLGL